MNLVEGNWNELRASFKTADFLPEGTISSELVNLAS